MKESFKKALEEYKDAYRLFNYAVTPQEVDTAILLIYAAQVKIKALKNIDSNVNFSDLEFISEVY